MNSTDRNSTTPRSARWAASIGPLSRVATRCLLFSLWLGLVTITPILTTLLMGATLLGLGTLLFFRVLLHAPAFPTATISAVTFGCLLTAAAINLLEALLRPR